MMLVTFSTGSTSRVGVVEADETGADVVWDVSALLPAGAGVLDVIEAWSELGPALSQHARGRDAMEPASVRLSAPIPVPRRNIFCVGKNYREHVAEFGRSGWS